MFVIAVFVQSLYINHSRPILFGTFGIETNISTTNLPHLSFEILASACVKKRMNLLGSQGKVTCSCIVHPLAQAQSHPSAICVAVNKRQRGMRPTNLSCCRVKATSLVSIASILRRVSVPAAWCFWEWKSPGETGWNPTPGAVKEDFVF